MDQQVQFPPSYSASSHSSWCSRTRRFAGAADVGGGCEAGGSGAASTAGTTPAHSMPSAARAAR